MEGINQIKISELPAKENPSTNDYLVMDDGSETSKIKAKNFINSFYPVGSIYMSVNDIEPSVLFGGTWEKIKDRFLLAAGDTYEAGSTGGEAEHALTVAELAKHKHQQRFGNKSGHNQNAIRYIEFTENIYGVTWVDNTSAMESGFTGEGKAHNNMPPYLTVNMWKRIS